MEDLVLEITITATQDDDAGFDECIEVKDTILSMIDNLEMDGTFDAVTIGAKILS